MPVANSIATANVFHSDSPQFFRRAALKLVANNAPKKVAPALQANTAEITEALSNALRSSVNGLESGAKRIMAACGCNQRTAENFLAGNNAPSALYMLRLMATCPEFAAEVRRLTGMREDVDPEFESDFERVVLKWAQKKLAQEED